MESIVETQASSILQFIHGLRGELHGTPTGLLMEGDYTQTPAMESISALHVANSEWRFQSKEISVNFGSLLVIEDKPHIGCTNEV
jgi:hypothetical protein